MKKRKEYTFKNKVENLVAGIGINDCGEFASHIRCEDGSKVPTKEYVVWSNMLNRCYNKTYHKTHPTYIGCYVSDNFKSFQYFARWCNSQIGFGVDGFHLDKDLISEGNYEYSENTCAFVPARLNTLLNENKRIKGVLPTGVCFSNKRNMYYSQISKYGVKYVLGYYMSIKEAFEVYKLNKEAYIKELANVYKDSVDARVFNSLLNHVVLMD